MFLQTRTLGLFLLAITLVTGLTAPDAMAANEAPADSWERLYSEAIAAHEQSRLDVAEQLQVEALALAETFGRSDTRRLMSLSALAGLYREQGRWAEAADLLKERVAVLRLEVVKSENKLRSEQSRLAQTLDAGGQHEHAQRMWKKMIEDANRIYGPHNLEEKHLEAALAHSYSLQGDYERAAELYSAVLAEMPDGASMAMLHSVHSQYADVLRHVGRESEAEAHERQAEALLQEIRSLKHQSVIE